MAELMQEIGREHGISPEAAFPYFERRDLAVDLAMYLPFLVLYGVAAGFAIRRLRDRPATS